MSKKILITSALPYVNNVPHLGNLVGCVLSADVYARFCRQKGYQTLYICGSDEHGTATETKAKEAGVTPKELCDKFYTLHKEIYEWFSISFDIFGRTSKENHHHITQELFKKVVEHGFVIEKTVTQPYSAKSNMFLADRFVIGTCPHCQFEQATGDQCDNCGRLLTPQELINPKAKIDGSTPEFKETDHLFLDLPTLQPYLEQWVNEASVKGSWTENAIRTTKAWFKEGLKERAITRDLEWGIKIPDTKQFGNKYADKVFYVWFDAPVGYISITQDLLKEKYLEWWQNKEVDLVQFMGKDNIPFHSIIFPATLMAASKQPSQSEYNLVHHLDVTEYINYENLKFSKSRGTGVFGDDAMKSGIPADVYRYVLMFYRPEGSDTQFTWKGVQERLNNELIANFGNFVNRTLTFTQRFFDGKTIAIDESALDADAQTFVQEFKEKTSTYMDLLEQVKLRDALMELMKASSLCNQYFQASQPWKTRTENETKAHTDLSLLIHAVRDLAILVEPYMPDTSKKIEEQLNTTLGDFSQVGAFDLGDHTIGTPEVLFTKLEDKEMQALQKKFSGKEEQKESSSSNKKKKKSKEVTPLQPSDLQVTVGQITDIKQHPDADKLYIEQVNIRDKTIQILSGLVPYYKAEELLNKKIFVVTNLKPAKMRGEMSHGMLLAAENEDGSIVEVLDAKDFEVGQTFSATAKEEIEFPEFMTLKFTIEKNSVFLNKEPFCIEQKQIKSEKIETGLVR